MRLGTFFRTFINTLTNPKYYVDVLNVRFWFTARFLILSYIVLTLVGALIFATIDTPKLQNSLSTFLKTEAERYPNNLNIHWDGLKISMTGAEKYVVPFPKLPDAHGVPPKLLEINPTATDVNQIEQSDSERSLAFVGQNTIFIAQPGGGWTDLPLSDVVSEEAFTINKESVQRELPTYQERLGTTLRALPFLFSAFFFLISFPLRLVSVLLDSLLIYFMVRISGLPLTLKKVIQISLHIMVAAELINILTANFSSGLQMFTIAFWGYTFIVYWNLRNIRALTPDEAERLSKG